MMKKKKYIYIFIILLFVVSIYFIYPLFTNHDDASPPYYNSISEFEKETNIKVAQFYDIDVFINSGKKVLLSNSDKGIHITNSSKQNYTEYFIETETDQIWSNYKVIIGNEFFKNTNNMNKTELDYGTFYQYNYKEDSGIRYVGYYILENMECCISFYNDTLDISTVENKFIEYIKLVEALNKF
ncbi:hypothetical protein [Longibaculum muris]|uniref:hypothetical protein n=1 Tax=Longibaculum muris TaxID=1796628 RepID=UPI0022E4C21E|nr:hypothetical protein [Longibaculum muris]